MDGKKLPSGLHWERLHKKKFCVRPHFTPPDNVDQGRQLHTNIPISRASLGEGSLKDVDPDSHLTERKVHPKLIALVTRNTLTMTKERPTLEDMTNHVEKSPEAIQDGFDLELQNHWFRLHLERKETKIPMDDQRKQRETFNSWTSVVLYYHIPASSKTGL